MLRDAKDLDHSGAISIKEVIACAQEKINKRMSNDPSYKAHNLVLNGNAAFVPAWFSQASLTPVLVAPAAPAPAPAAVTSAASAAATAPTPAPAPVPAPKPLTGEQALRQLYDQRDAKRDVQVSLGKSSLSIGRDALDLAVTSDRDGFLYLALAGSDNKSVYMLFPNDLDTNNKISAGQKLSLPRPHWRVTAGGPAGRNHLIVMVTDAPRDLSALAGSKAGPFVASLNDAQGRAQLGGLMTTARATDSSECQNLVNRAMNTACSDAYGATMVSVEEVK
jgi:hypothetical protein